MDLLSALSDLAMLSGPCSHWPPTLLHNEGWLLRIVLSWCASHPVPSHPLSFCRGADWCSEALLPSAFLARHRGDPLAEAWTHADAVLGHFRIGGVGRGDLRLTPASTQFACLEAKLYAPLASRTTRISGYDQVARTVACMAETLHRAERDPRDLEVLSFHVVVPQDRLGPRTRTMLDKESIRTRATARIAAYGGALDGWHAAWFVPTLDRLTIAPLTWEELIGQIEAADGAFGARLAAFYATCVAANVPSPVGSHPRS